nr:hypothetical protein [uncultured Mediterranean phage uvMED]
MPEGDKKRVQQAKADANRRFGHFQVRLSKQLAEQLQHYADAHHDGVKNAALKMILSRFFNNV